MPLGSSHTPPDGIQSALPLRMKLRRNCKPEIVRLLQRTSYIRLQTRSHLLRRAEQAVLGGLFGCAQNVADGAQTQPLIVPEFENGPLTGRQSFERRHNTFA